MKNIWRSSKVMGLHHDFAVFILADTRSVSGQSKTEREDKDMSNYIMNLETQKIELHFDKADYMALSDDLKKEIKSNFLFSRKSGVWVSRAKFPNLWRAETVAKKLGLENGGSVGETLTFAEQMERKAERAEARAERYDNKSEKAQDRAEALQKPVNDMHGDISFFTQPNINSSAGRAFTNRRNRMFSAWEKGFEEFRKSEYYAERAAAARQTAEDTRPADKGFIDRRIKDAEKTIKAQRKNIEDYRKYLERIENGEEMKQYNGDILTAEMVQEWIENAELIIENAISKSIYYHECMEEAGGVAFSKDNIKTGYIVELDRWGKCRVTGTGKVNISYSIMEGGAAGYGGKAAYAEIKSIISEEVPEKPEHPFKVGDSYTVQVWNSEKCTREPKEYIVTKITPERVTLKTGEERAVSRNPRRFKDNSTNGFSWAVGVVDGYGGTIYKKETDTI